VLAALFPNGRVSFYHTSTLSLCSVPFVDLKGVDENIAQNPFTGLSVVNTTGGALPNLTRSRM